MTAKDMANFAARTVFGWRLATTPAFPADLWQAMGSQGLFGIGLPKEFGGTGGGYAEIAAAERDLTRLGGSLGFALSWTGHQMVARYFILGFGDAGLRRMWLPPLADGSLTASVAISEPGAGAHPKNLKTTATADGDDFVIDGEKTYVTNGPIAGLFVVLAITSVEDGRKRYSAFLVPRQTAGLEVVPMPQLNMLWPSPHCSLRLNGCRVGRAQMLGAMGTAYETMALPFRDVEDAVGISGLGGILRFAAHRAARNLPASAHKDAAGSLGEIEALLAVLDRSAGDCAAALDSDGLAPEADRAGVLVGARLLVGTILDRLRALGADALPDGEGLLDAALRDVDASLSIARGPRMVKQARLGLRLLQAASRGTSA